jgi:hypothetical protein
MYGSIRQSDKQLRACSERTSKGWLSLNVSNKSLPHSSTQCMVMGSVEEADCNWLLNMEAENAFDMEFVVEERMLFVGMGVTGVEGGCCCCCCCCDVSGISTDNGSSS